MKIAGFKRPKLKGICHFFWLAFVAASLVCGSSYLAFAGGAALPKVVSWTLDAEFPHDQQAFTQGLEVFEGRYFLESTGQYGQSELRKVEIKSGRVITKVPLDKKYFGEGLTRVGNEILQLTWQEGVILKWSIGHGSKDFDLKATIPWTGEGWGITRGGGDLFVSNGSSEIAILDGKSLKVKRSLKVTLSGKEMDRLNELEFVNGKLFANVWMTSTIVRIDPKTGQIDGLMDLGPLVPKGLSLDAVANGIAWDAKKKILYVTGKLWPKVFALKLG